MKISHLLVAALSLYSAGAHAEVKQSAADSFLVTYSEPVTATPAKAYADIAQVQHWWSDEHTWSGKAANLSLDPDRRRLLLRALERRQRRTWSRDHGAAGSAPARRHRARAAAGIRAERDLEFLDQAPATTARPGSRSNTASTVPAAADWMRLRRRSTQVLGAQVARLVRYIDTGNPEVPTAAPEPPKSADAQAALLDQWAQQAAREQAAKGGVAKPIPAKPAKKP